MPRPLNRPQTAKNCGSNRFDARIQILTEMYSTHQYLSIDVIMNADVSETIKDGELASQI